jgi:signal transduction histidine kinase
MLQMVEDLLDLSAAELGHITVRAEEVDALALVQECLAKATVLAEAGGLELQAPAAPAGPLVLRCDPKRLKQVLNNLLSNAIKYTHQGGRVQVQLADLGSSAEISVHDNGPGLRADQLRRIFQPFERLGAEKTGTPGTGLGLALVRTLVELMGGSIRVDSTVGVGSTFTVCLPKAPQV